MLDDSQYQQLADQAFRRIEDAFKDVDAEDVDLERAGDVVTLTFRSGARCVINTQRPTRQIWLAANARAWHFDYDAPSGSWKDDKGRDGDLFAHIARIVGDAGIAITV